MYTVGKPKLDFIYSIYILRGSDDLYSLVHLLYYNILYY